MIGDAVRVYKVARLAGHDHEVAMIAANKATRALVLKDPRTVSGGWEFWKGIKTPGMIQDEILRIDSEVKTTGSDMATLEANHLHDASGHDITEFMDTVWDPFVNSWSKFKSDHMSSWVSNFWGDTWDEAQTYQRTLIKIRDKAKELGMTLRSPDPTVQKTNPFEDVIKAMWALVKFVIIGIVIIGGIVVIGRLV